MGGLSKILRNAEDGRLLFWCPGCDGAHMIRVQIGPGPGWSWNGDVDRPTFQPSILVNPGRSNPEAHLCHSFVADGRIQFLGDCTHELAGQTVDLPAWNDA